MNHSLRSMLVTALAAGAMASAFAQATDQPTGPTPPVPPAPAASAPVFDERASVQLAFTRADADSDGKLSTQEAGRLPAVAARFADLDRDRDGFISSEEFLAGVRIQR